MLSNEILLEKWNRLSYYSSSYMRIDASHPLEWHIGYEDINQKSLLLLSSFEPEPMLSSKSIKFSFGQRADGKWAIVFCLIRDENEDVFIRLCCDLIESSRKQDNTIHGHNFVLKRYKQWTKLMEQQKSGILGESERKGLIGEILFLQQRLSVGLPLIETLSGWIGPEGADQDFVYSNGWFEIKALGMGAKTVSISSIEQLNVPLPGELVMYYIDKTAPNAVNSFTLLNKIAEVRDLLQNSSLAYDLFNEKLLQYGYVDAREYEQYWYRLCGTNRYCVDSSFPRLTKENVPAQIATVNYQISIQAIESWKVF